LRTRDAAAEIVAYCGQGEVDRIGIDQSDEKTQVRRDQRDNRSVGDPVRVHACTLGAE
jgi:hypothetical protein